MSDIKKDDDPTIIPETDLDDVAAGMKIPNIFSGDSKLIDDFSLSKSTTITADIKGDKGDILIQNIGFPDDQGGSGKI